VFGSRWTQVCQYDENHDQGPGTVVYFSRTHLKNVFWPNIFIGASLQILDIQPYACGLKLGSAAILSQNPIFEIGSNKKMLYLNFFNTPSACGGVVNFGIRNSLFDIRYSNFIKRIGVEGVYKA